MSVEAMKQALDVLVHVTTLSSKKARDGHAKAVSGLREAIAAAGKAESMENSASAKFEAMHARGIVWISTIAAAKLVQKAEPADAAMLAEKDALLRQALDALEGFVCITNDSQGVAGYHLSGDTAEWDEFDEVDAASNTIEAIRTHLGVKND